MAVSFFVFCFCFVFFLLLNFHSLITPAHQEMHTHQLPRPPSVSIFRSHKSCWILTLYSPWHVFTILFLKKIDRLNPWKDQKRHRFFRVSSIRFNNQGRKCNSTPHVEPVEPLSMYTRVTKLQESESLILLTPLSGYFKPQNLLTFSLTIKQYNCTLFP